MVGTDNSARQKLHGAEESVEVSSPRTEAEAVVAASASDARSDASDTSAPVVEPRAEKHFTIRYGDIGYLYQSLFGGYLLGAKALIIEDPYIRKDYQLRKLIQVCELAIQTGTLKQISLVTGSEHDYQRREFEPKLKSLAESLADSGVEFRFRFDEKIHDRELRTDTGWHIRIGIPACRLLDSDRSEQPRSPPLHGKRR
jgi:ATP-dependent Lon protease